jgi:hypothetical protein
MMNQLAEGLVYSGELNKIVYSNDFIMNSGLNLQKVSELLGNYAEYISDDERDLLYAKSNGIKVFDESVKGFNYSLSGFVDLDKEIEILKGKNPDFADVIQDEYDYVSQNEHNVLLLRIAFLLKRHLDKHSNGVYLMRGSGVSSYIFYAIGLNRVNPYKFGLSYMDFWNN